jgi:hypothetical protein
MTAKQKHEKALIEIAELKKELREMACFFGDYYDAVGEIAFCVDNNESVSHAALLNLRNIHRQKNEQQKDTI